MSAYCVCPLVLVNRVLASRDHSVILYVKGHHIPLAILRKTRNVGLRQGLEKCTYLAQNICLVTSKNVMIRARDFDDARVLHARVCAIRSSCFPCRKSTTFQVPAYLLLGSIFGWAGRQRLQQLKFGLRLVPCPGNS